MKIMTLNTHSLIEQDYPQKLQHFVHGVLTEMPDVIALQEVNQSITAPIAEGVLLTGYVPAQDTVPVRVDNHAANVARLLRTAGIAVSWTYLPIKVGYGRYDEGLALLTLNRRITRVDSCLISRTDDYHDWRTRKALAIQAEGLKDWFCTVHMGWWQDEQEPFLAQWKALNAFMTARLRHAPVWMMGDFNAPAEVRGESYDRIADAGWYDTFLHARERDSGVTVPGAIDGWHEPPEGLATGPMRLDLIWCSTPVGIAVSRVIFNGENQPVVSDHFGVMVETLPPAQTPCVPLQGSLRSAPEDIA